MKYLFTLLSILCIYIVKSQTPIHVFNFDGSLTNTANTVTLTRSGSATTTYAADRFGFANKACVNPLGQALQATINNLPLGNSARSVSIWVNFSGGFSNTHFIWSYGTNLTSQAFGLTQEPASVINYGWANDHVATLGYVQGNWYNYVITYDGAFSKIYRNGTLISQSTKAWNTVGNIFRIATNPATTLYLNATIDELRIYNVALTATQVANIYAGADLPTITNMMSSAGSTPTNYYINYKLLANDANATAVVKYGTSINNLNLTSTSSTATGTTALNASVLLSGLSTTTKYYYQIEATNSFGTKSSLIDSFNTSNVAALPTLNPATATVDATTARINYTAQANFANTTTRVVYGTSKTNLNLNTADSSVFANASNPVTNCTGFISGLTINTKYYYQIEAVNIMGTTRSVIDSFTVNEFLRQGLVAYYGLENSLFSFDGIHNLTEGTTVTRTFAAGKYGLGSNFSNNPLINTSISSLLNNDTTQTEYTICFWENRNSIITFQSSFELFGSQYFRSQNNSNVGFRQGLANASASNFVETTTNSFAFNLMNAWQHYAVQVKKVGNTKFLRTYINGVLEAELNLGNAAFVYKFHDKIAIGGGTDGAGAIQTVKFFSGSLDEIYFYNRALSPAEITSVQNNATGIIFNGIVAKPTLRFDSVTNLTNAGATINFGVKTNNGITNTSIKYSTNKTALTNVLSGATLGNNVGNTFQPTTITVTGLLNNTKYYYQVKALNSAGADSTLIDSFVTKDAIQPGLIAYYGFENNFNSHNAQNNLTSATTNATVPNFVTGKFGQSVNLSGSNALVNSTISSFFT
nr:LamG domain-containing protein [Chitinophagaceae bacterium]